jgi:predicted nuclease of predicted toxin-antitoxin system
LDALSPRYEPAARTCRSVAAEGHDAIHVLDTGYGDPPDSDICVRAATDGRIVVTFDLDFGEIAGLVHGAGSSVVLLRLSLVRQSHLWNRLKVAIAAAGEAMEAGAIVLVEDARIRIRRMPPQE